MKKRSNTKTRWRVTADYEVKFALESPRADFDDIGEILASLGDTPENLQPMRITEGVLVQTPLWLASDTGLLRLRTGLQLKTQALQIEASYRSVRCLTLDAGDDVTQGIPSAGSWQACANVWCAQAKSKQTRSAVRPNRPPPS